MNRRYAFALATLLLGGVSVVSLTWFRRNAERPAESPVTADPVAPSSNAESNGPSRVVGGADAYRDRVAAMIRSHRLPEADAAIREWMNSYPNDERAHLARAELFATTGRPGEAIDTFTDVVERAADPARVWLRVADLQQGMGQSQAAIEACRHAVDADPDHADAAIRLGDLLRIEGRLAEAADVLEPWLQRNAGLIEVRHALAAVRNGQSRFADVVALIEPVLDAADLPDNARQHYAVALEELERWTEAADVWAALLERDPYVVEGYYRLGRLARRLKRRELMQAAFAAYEDLTDYKDRLEAARKLALGGQADRAALERAAAYVSTDQIAPAIEQYQSALRVASRPTDAFLGAMLFLIDVELFAEAQELLESFREHSGVPQAAWHGMAGLLAERTERPSAAADAYENALNAAPDYAPALVALARIRLDADEMEAAATLLARLPDSATRSETAWLHGRLAFARGDLPSARVDFERAASLARKRSDQGRAWLGLGLVRLAASDSSGALAWLEQAVAAEPWSPKAWEALARACRALDRAERADEATRKHREARNMEREIAATRRELPTSSAASRGENYRRLAELAVRREEVRRARRYLIVAAFVNTQDAEASARLAALYTEPKDLFRRARALRRAAAMRTDADFDSALEKLYRRHDLNAQR